MTWKDVAYKRRLAPDLSYDIDGDGCVSQRDFFIASLFDKNKDGILDEAERETAVKAINEKGLLRDHMRDYYTMDTELGKLEKCTSFKRIMKNTVKKSRPTLRDTYIRIIDHPGQFPEKLPYITEYGKMQMGDKAVSKPEDLAPKPGLFLSRKINSKSLFEKHNKAREDRQNERTMEINSALRRRYAAKQQDTSMTNTFSSTRSLLLNKRRIQNMEQNVKRGAEIGPIFPGDIHISNVPNHMLPGDVGVSMRIVAENHPKQAYSKGPLLSRRITEKRREESSLRVTQPRVFGTHHNHADKRNRYSSTAKEQMASSFHTFHATATTSSYSPNTNMCNQNNIRSNLTRKCIHTTPSELSKSCPFPVRLSNKASMTNKKHSYFDYLKVGRALDRAARIG